MVLKISQNCVPNVILFLRPSLGLLNRWLLLMMAELTAKILVALAIQLRKVLGDFKSFCCQQNMNVKKSNLFAVTLLAQNIYPLIATF